MAAPTKSMTINMIYTDGGTPALTAYQIVSEFQIFGDTFGANPVAVYDEWDDAADGCAESLHVERNGNELSSLILFRI